MEPVKDGGVAVSVALAVTVGMMDAAVGAGTVGDGVSAPAGVAEGGVINVVTVADGVVGCVVAEPSFPVAPEPPLAAASSVSESIALGSSLSNRDDREESCSHFTDSLQMEPAGTLTRRPRERRRGSLSPVRMGESTFRPRFSPGQPENSGIAGGLRRGTVFGKALHALHAGLGPQLYDAKFVVVDHLVVVGTTISRSGQDNAENVLEITDGAFADRFAAFADEPSFVLPGVQPDRQPARSTMTRSEWGIALLNQQRWFRTFWGERRPAQGRQRNDLSPRKSAAKSLGIEPLDRCLARIRLPGGRAN